MWCNITSEPFCKIAKSEIILRRIRRHASAAGSPPRGQAANEAFSPSSPSPRPTPVLSFLKCLNSGEAGARRKHLVNSAQRSLGQGTGPCLRLQPEMWEDRGHVFPPHTDTQEVTPFFPGAPSHRDAAFLTGVTETFRHLVECRYHKCRVDISAYLLLPRGFWVGRRRCWK